MALMVCSGCSTRYAPGLERCPHCGQTGAVEEGSRGSRLPFLDVSCPSQGCRAVGVVRRVHLRQVTPGVIEMPHLLLCTGCGAAMLAVAAQIGPVPVPVEILEESMAKITRHGGPTNAAADRERESAGRPPANEVCSNCGKPYGEPACGISHAMVAHERGLTSGIEVPAGGTESPEITGGGTGTPLPPADDSTGEGESSPVNSSSTSATKRASSPAKKKPAPRKRAPATGSRSSRARAESSTADGTASSGPETPDEGQAEGD